MFQRALESIERVLGPEHPDTLASVNNLAYLYKSRDRYAEAEPLNTPSSGLVARTSTPFSPNSTPHEALGGGAFPHLSPSFAPVKLKVCRKSS